MLLQEYIIWQKSASGMLASSASWNFRKKSVLTWCSKTCPRLYFSTYCRWKIVLNSNLMLFFLSSTVTGLYFWTNNMFLQPFFLAPHLLIWHRPGSVHSWCCTVYFIGGKPTFVPHVGFRREQLTTPWEVILHDWYFGRKDAWVSQTSVNKSRHSACACACVGVTLYGSLI